MLLQYAFKELTRRKSRSLLAIVSVALSMTLLVSIRSISSSVNKAVAEPLTTSGSDIVVQKRVTPCPFAAVKRPKDLGAMPGTAVDEIREIDGIRDVMGVLELWAFSPPKPGEKTPPTAGKAGKGGSPETTFKPTVVTGIPAGPKALGPIATVKTEDNQKCCTLKDGRFFKGHEERAALVEIGFASVAKVSVGDTLALPFEGTPPETRDFEIVGIVQPKASARIAAGQVYIPLATSQAMLSNYFTNEEGVVDTIFVRLWPYADRAKVSEAIKGIIGEGCHLTESSTLTRDVAGLSLLTGSVTKAISLVALVLTVLLILRTGWAAVSERRREIGVLKTIGWRTGDVVRLLSVEILIQNMLGAFIGAMAGLFVGSSYANSANLALPAALNSYPECASTPAPLELTLLPPPASPMLLSALGLALVLGFVAALLAGRRAAKLDPAVALRSL